MIIHQGENRVKIARGIFWGARPSRAHPSASRRLALQLVKRQSPERLPRMLYSLYFERAALAPALFKSRASNRNSLHAADDQHDQQETDRVKDAGHEESGAVAVLAYQITGPETKQDAAE